VKGATRYVWAPRAVFSRGFGAKNRGLLARQRRPPRSMGGVCGERGGICQEKGAQTGGFEPRKPHDGTQERPRRQKSRRFTPKIQEVCGTEPVLPTEGHHISGKRPTRSSNSTGHTASSPTLAETNCPTDSTAVYAVPLARDQNPNAAHQTRERVHHGPSYQRTLASC